MAHASIYSFGYNDLNDVVDAFDLISVQNNFGAIDDPRTDSAW